MSNFSTKQLSIFPNFDIDVREKEKIDCFINFLDKSGVDRIINKYVNSANFLGGRPQYNPFNLFAGILYAFVIKKTTLREIEDGFRNDLRLLYIMNNEIPSHTTINRFIQKVIQPNRDEIFSLITSAIFKECHLTMETLFIDGTKQEANSNKYKFVWKPITFHNRLDAKIRNLLSILGIDIDTQGWISSGNLIKYMDKIESQLMNEGVDLTTKKSNDERIKQLENLNTYLLKVIEYEEKERICGPNRNSYYKTDHDATAMCLKSDYYSGVGSNMHAAYQVQFAIAHWFITDYYVDQNRVDSKSFIPTLEKHYKMYHEYPESVSADAGYGTEAIYRYLDDRNIKAYVKYNTWEYEIKGKLPPLYEVISQDTIRCLGGKMGQVVHLPFRHHNRGGTAFFKIEDCSTCIFMPYCRRHFKVKDDPFRIFDVNVKYVLFKQQARDLLLSPDGIVMRVNRSCQIEGSFGVLKQDLNYIRFRRRSIEKVTTELMLYCLSYNIGKLLRYYDGKTRFDYWKPKIPLTTEKIKKPSAKILNRRATKPKSISVNEIANKMAKRKKRP